MPGTNDYGPGKNRVSFLVVDKQSKLIERPTAQVWVSRGLKQKPYAQTTATLEPIGVPGGATADAQNIYVTTLDMPKPGKYWILAEPIGGTRRSRRSATRSCCATRRRPRSVRRRSRPRTPMLEHGRSTRRR